MMGRPTADAINRARTETQGYLDHCRKQLAEGVDVKATHIAKLEAILAGLDALDRVAVLEAQLEDRAEQVNDLIVEAALLEEQRADLLPLVWPLASFTSPDSEWRECAWCRGFSCGHEDTCPVTAAGLLWDRMEDGRFAGVSVKRGTGTGVSRCEPVVVVAGEFGEVK